MKMHLSAFLVAVFFLTSCGEAAERESNETIAETVIVEGVSSSLPLELAGNKFMDAFEAGDYDFIISTMPDNIIKELTSQNKMSEKELADQIALVMKETLTYVEFLEIKMDYLEAKERITPSGKIYFIIPTTTAMRVEGGAIIEIESDTIVFDESGYWKFVSVQESEQIALLLKAYPEFDNVKFRGSTTTMRQGN